MSLLGSFKYHKQALIMSNDADQPNSVLDEKWTHSLQNFEIYCTFIGWSLLPPFFPRPPPQKKKHTKSSQRIMAGENWERPTNSTWRSDPWHNTTATIATVLVAVNPKLWATWLEGGYPDTWSDQNLQSQLGGVEDIDYMTIWLWFS